MTTITLENIDTIDFTDTNIRAISTNFMQGYSHDKEHPAIYTPDFLGDSAIKWTISYRGLISQIKEGLSAGYRYRILYNSELEQEQPIKNGLSWASIIMASVRLGYNNPAKKVAETYLKGDFKAGITIESAESLQIGALLARKYIIAHDLQDKANEKKNK